MTHEKLLAEIDFLPLHGLCAWMQPALRAVVELHKPNPIPHLRNAEEVTLCWCAHTYPCETIRAIEKELE